MNVIGASARELKKVRITFDAAVDYTAYLPENYVFAAQREIVGNPQPGAYVTVVAVLEVPGLSGVAVDVVVSDELSPLVNYLVTVTGVEDLSTVYNKIVFQALDFPAPVGRDFNISSHFNHIASEEVSLDKDAFFAVLDEALKVLLLDVDRFTDIVDPDVCAEKYLDLMLADLGNPFANFELSETDKRRLIRLLLPIAKQKGSKVGIENVIRLFLQYESELISSPSIGMRLGISLLGIDWVLGHEGPYEFQIRIATPTGELTTLEHSKARQIALYMKFAQDQLVRVYGCLFAPLNLVATTPAPGSVTLTWDHSSSGMPAGGYRIYWRNQAGVKTFNATPINGVTSPYTIVGVPAGQTRHFVVSAVNGSGLPGFESNEVSATAT